MQGGDYLNNRHYNYKGRTSKSSQSKSQRKREAYDYRSAYFRKNPGLFGCIWICSQCGIPMIGRHNVQVDHIIPLAGIGINRTINTVAICAKCNSEKSDKTGKYVVKGVIAKCFEMTYFTLQKIILQLLVGILRIIHLALFFIIDSIKMLLDTFDLKVPALAIAVIIILAIMLFT